MLILMTGASGLIGTALKARLRQDGHQLRVLVRRPPGGPDERSWDPADGRLDHADLAGVDAVINLSGAGVGDHRWSDAYKKTLLDSRLQPTSLLARTVAELGADAPPTFVSASAVGYYGDTADHVVDESAGGGSGFLADLTRQWEAATGPADALSRVVHLRTGLVLSRSGGLLGRLKTLVDFGAAGPLGSGNQYQPWISLADEVGAIAFLLSADVRGPVNLTGPDPVPQREFIKALAAIRHRPALVPAPGFALRLLLGQFADEGVLIGQRAVPGVLTSTGYVFEHPTLDAALHAALD